MNSLIRKMKNLLYPVYRNPFNKLLKNKIMTLKSKKKNQQINKLKMKKPKNKIKSNNLSRSNNKKT